MKVSFTKSSGGRFVILVNGVPHTVSNSHPMYKQIDFCLAAGDYDRVVGLLNVPDAIQRLSGNQLELSKDGSAVLYCGHEIDYSCSSTIIRLIHEDMPFIPYINFLAKMVRNPSRRAQHELYPFMLSKRHHDGTEHAPLPITTDGDFLAYKSVRYDWMDHHKGVVRNMPGDAPEMPRFLADDDFGKNCSEGFHVGSLAYVRDFYPRTGMEDSPRIVVTKQSPEDVVSVPSDASCTKCRVVKYRVLREYEAELTRPVYATVEREEHTDLEPVAPAYNEHPLDRYL